MSQSKLKSISFPISWFHGPQFAYVYVAKEKGFFEKEGLNVNIVENQGSEITSMNIGRGEYPLGMVGAESAMIFRSKGMPLKVVAVADKVNPNGITCHKKSRISKPKHLRGKKVGVTLGSNAYQQYLAFTKKEGLNQEEIEEIPISGSGHEWLNSDVDCHVLYPFLNESIAETKNLKVNSLLFYDHGIKTYGQTLVANSKIVETNPDLVMKVTRAIVKGLQYERAHPKEALEISFKLNPQIKKDREYHEKVFWKRLELDKKLDNPEKAGNGLQDRHVWEATKDLLESLELLESEVNLGEFFTNEFIDKKGAKEKSSTILARGIFKNFKDKKKITKVLKDIDFEINEGEFISLLGASGCGKTTFLKIISGLNRDYRGEVLIDGFPLSPKIQRKFSFVTQEESLLPWKTVKENILFFVEILGRVVNVNKIIKEVGLEGFENHYPNELSGGMKKRAILARALITKPHILFLDEPFGALDTITRAKMNELVMDLAKKHSITTVLVTHNIDEAAFLSDKVVLLKGSPAKIKRIYPIPFKRPRKRSIISNTKYAKIVGEIYGEIEKK